jgi:hypothetical protein
MKASEGTRATKIIQDQVLSTLEVQPHNYLQLTHSNEKYHVTVIHRPTVYSVPMGVQSEHDGTVTAFVGDVRSGMAPNVVFWPEEPFTPSTLVNVPTPEVIDAAYAGDAEIQLVGPYQDGEAAVDPITVRPLMYLPPKFVPLVMSAPYLTPRECWNRLAAQLRLTQESADAHKPLLQWLRAACTIGPTGHPANLSEIPSYPFPPDKDLDTQVAKVLKADLPGLFPSPEGTMPGTREVVGAINNLTEEQRATREEATNRQAKAAEKSPATYFGTATLVLNRITHTSTVAELPQVYHLLASSSKKTERLVLQEALNDAARELNLPAYAPIATPELTKKVTMANFTQEDPDDLSLGVHPFITGYRTTAERTILHSHIGAYDTLLSGTGAGLSDIFKIKESEKVSLPLSILQTTYSLKSCKVLLYCLLAEGHPLVLEIDKFMRLWDSHLMDLEAECTDPLAPAKFLRWVQIRLCLWFKNQYNSSERQSVPNLCALFPMIQEMRQWKPPLPTRYLAPAAPAPSSRAPAPSAPSRSSAPAPAPALPGPASSAPGQNRERITSPTYRSDDYSRFKDLGISMRTIRDTSRAAGKPVPHSDTGTEMCLSYHVLGFCWHNCTRAEDHRVHTVPETTRLKEWCGMCYREGGPL